MQNPLPATAPGLPGLLLLGLGGVAGGLAAAWLAARLAGGDGPAARRLRVAMAAAGVVLSVSAAAARTDELGWSLGLGWALAVLAGVDLLALRLPDVLTLPLMGAGLARAALAGDDLAGHGAGLLVGYAAIAAVGWGFMRLRGRRGIGLGDAKLFAAAGAWVGWAALPAVLLIACGLGLAGFALAALLRGRERLRAQAPFGVALCCALWAVWLGA